MDNQAQVFVGLDRAVAEHRTHVEDTQSAHLQAVTQQRRAGAVDDVRANQRHVRGVVRHQPVAARDQFERQLALARPAVTGDQHPEAEHFHENTMHGRVARYPARQHVLQMAGEFDARGR